MLERAGTMFDDMAGMLSHIKKKVYSERMECFRKNNAQILAEMVNFVEQAKSQKEAEIQKEVEVRKEAEIQKEVKVWKEAEAQKEDEVQKEGEVQGMAQKQQEAAAQVAKALADAVEARFAKRGRISGRTQMDINLMMIYYVFPAILLTESACAVPLADAIRDEWRGRFRDSEQLGYATYEELSGTFKEKILGMF